MSNLVQGRKIKRAGPVQVTRDNRTYGYSESLTYTYT
jgi:hypothetical protein